MSDRQQTVAIDRTRVTSLRERMQDRSEGLFRAVGAAAPDDEPQVDQTRDHVSMEAGRDQPPDTPFVDRSRARLRAEDLELSVRADVSRWSRREIAASTVHLHLQGPGFSVSVGRNAQGTDQVDSLAVRAQGLDDDRFEAVVAWVRGL